MKIIKQYHQILSLPENGLQMLEKAGRTCYKSEDKITHDSAEKFVDMLVRREHHAMIEFADMIVKFVTNRGVTHELVRHRHCSFAQESTRYVKYEGEMEFIKPVWWSDHSDTQGKTPAEQIWMTSMERAESDYKTLLRNGWKAQQAREILPNSLKTEIVVKANIREWRHIFNLRCAKTSHPQMVELMLPLLKEAQKKIPVVFDDLIF
ncbi:MAG: FAD-dependent thymidylate synthase [Desulfobacteraceae bacterium]|nr:FAD-dependent thymidylate synthase [Desulfobacteraceae bacterium]